MLRQQARLHSLHLTKYAEEEEEETVPDQDRSVEEEDEGEEGQGDIQVPAELRVSCYAAVSQTVCLVASL